MFLVRLEIVSLQTVWVDSGFGSGSEKRRLLEKGFFKKDLCLEMLEHFMVSLSSGTPQFRESSGQ